MSMAISRISASGVAGMLYGMPVSKPRRVATVDSGDRARMVVTGTPSQAVQGASRPQPADTSSTPEQVHAAFQYALAFQGNGGMTGGTMAQSNAEVQSGGVQQAGSAYAQVEQQQAGQVLDITA